jgi:hypothetical protein
MPIDPRTGEEVDSLPSMDADGHIPSAREVRQLGRVLRKQVAAMAEVVGDVHPPHPNSILARLDTAAFARETPSVIIMNALVSACAHLSSAHDFIKTSAANRITAWSLLRPTLMSATTAGWILVATNSNERLRRAAVVVNEAMRYEVAYARNVDRIPGGQAAERLAWIEQRLADLNEWAVAAGLQLRGRDRVPMTEAVAEVAASVGAEEARISALWSEMSSGAHGLGWHIQSRTFGAGTTALEGSNFVRFPVELDRAYYFGVVANLTDYTNRILTIARALATERAALEASGLITTAEDGEWVLRLDL